MKFKKSIKKIDKTIEDFYEFQLRMRNNVYIPLWTVHFVNGRGLSIDETKEFFSKYGKVYRVGQSYTPEKTKGLCFVYFKSEESARKCVSDMKNSETIRLRPFLNPEYPKDHCHYKNLLEDSVYANSTDLITFYESLADKSAVNVNSHADEDREAKNNNKMRANESIDEKCRIINESYEVIVANIPENVGVNLIVEIFKEYEPLAASNIGTVPEKFVRYCHVYFGDSSDAESVERDYDNVQLFGNNLIVLRANALAAEALENAQ